ncbi:MAG TPA: contact-dependent growth inhibition system immunity protein [Chitinophagaceae bacterium]
MPAKDIYLSKSIEQLEGVWERFDPPTPLLEKVHRFRKVPISELTIEQLRLLIGQNVGLIYLIPIAIQKLRANIFAEGDLYEGDLLSSVLTSEDSFWEQHSLLKRELQDLLKGNRPVIEEKNVANQYRQLIKKIDAFQLK